MEINHNANSFKRNYVSWSISDQENILLHSLSFISKDWLYTDTRFCILTSYFTECVWFGWKVMWLTWSIHEPWVDWGEAGKGQFEAKETENLMEEEDQDCHIILWLIILKYMFLEKQDERQSNTFEIILEAQHQINCATKLSSHYNNSDTFS